MSLTNLDVPLTQLYWLFTTAANYERHHKADIQLTIKTDFTVRLETKLLRPNKSRVEWFPDCLKAMGWLDAGLNNDADRELLRLAAD